MTVEFISAINVNRSNELNGLGETAVDPGFFRSYVHALEDAGFDYTLVPYASAYHDPFAVANAIVANSERIAPIVALRPNLMYPTVAAKALATLDQFGGGRAVVHLIAGGSDHEQAREGDELTKAQRYDRQAEFIDVMRKVWTSTEPFDHEGEHYRFHDFVSAVRPTRGTIPVSVGGSSAEAYRVGGSRGDVFGLWGEPLADTREQIDRVYAEAERAGRTDRPRIWVTFRPIIAATEELAWERAHRTLAVLQQGGRPRGWRTDTLGARVGANGLGGTVLGGTVLGGTVPGGGGAGGATPANVGSQRLLEIASRGDVHDRALWTPTATATGAQGASTALVGTPETVAAAILDYVDLGADLISIRGYDNYHDVIDYGRSVLPLVRSELAHREATGQRGALQDAHLGALAG